MGEFNEFPHRLAFDRRVLRVESGRPAPPSSQKPSTKVREALADILPRITDLKQPIEMTGTELSDEEVLEMDPPPTDEERARFDDGSARINEAEKMSPQELSRRIGRTGIGEL